MDSSKVECYQCHKQVTIHRKNVSYWPDHLWPGAVSASYKCPKCKKLTGKWAHELPPEWKKDWPRPDWEEYCVPRLLDSCYLHNIKPAIFKDSLMPYNTMATRRGCIATWRSRLARWIDGATCC